MTERRYVLIGETDHGFQILSKGDSLGAGPLSREESEVRLRFYRARFGRCYKSFEIAEIEIKMDGRDL